jgi:aldehyde dehydrogenase (NAD+)
MISEGEAVRVEGWVKEAVAAGAELMAGGTRSRSVVAPTILARTAAAMKVECEELFAPVVTLAPFDELDEALARVNDSRYGLQAGIFTRDFAAIEKAFATLEVGGLVVNDVPTWRADRMPYGGAKESGNAREGPAYAMETFTESRLLVLGT